MHLRLFKQIQKETGTHRPGGLREIKNQRTSVSSCQSVSHCLLQKRYTAPKSASAILQHTMQTPVSILIVEDDPDVASLLHKGLSEAGYQISLAFDGVSALSLARQQMANLLILDVMLPGKTGLEICATLRSEGIDTPILMLTALASTEQIVHGLDAGADDYMVKPFKLAELMARVRNLIRRAKPTAGDAAPTSNDQPLQMADLVLLPRKKAAERNGQPISLTATEYRLLEYLMQNPNRVLSRQDILENVWGIDFNLSTNVVDVYINYLRKKIDKPHQQKLIQTIIGMGYALQQEHDT